MARRRHSSLNECVSAICQKCADSVKKSTSANINNSHNCAKHTGASGTMEPVIVYLIFERSSEIKNLQYVDFYSDGDSKGYDGVKDIYGEKSVTKYECIGHIQNRVDSRLREELRQEDSWESQLKTL
ncbi:hypothetical protein AVEN_57922-1 [Araneus ventricosus]|uniref:Mutator-like transposase domain-containing protein n=1 Tax=Araneus ventricosus TaxID=182803 RepID=A0A4Y2KJN9_ARAVE|nr:hypothetical protein AVEN_57922-1 [Araneus ventricosus]